MLYISFAKKGNISDGTAMINDDIVVEFLYFVYMTFYFLDKLL